MTKSNYVHGINIDKKIGKRNSTSILNEIKSKYEEWKASNEKLNSEIEKELKRKVVLLNDYKNYIDTVAEKHFKLQDKLASSVIEEFLFYLFKDIPNISPNLEKGLLFIGQAEAYTDLSFAPKNLLDFIERPGIYINKKNQDFTISKIVKCIFETNGEKELVELNVSAIAIECKTFIPSTMLGQSNYEAQRLKQGNPFSLYIIVAEQNALSEDVNLKNSPID